MFNNCPVPHGLLILSEFLAANLRTHGACVRACIYCTGRARLKLINSAFKCRVVCVRVRFCTCMFGLLSATLRRVHQFTAAFCINRKQTHTQCSNALWILNSPGALATPLCKCKLDFRTNQRMRMRLPATASERSEFNDEITADGSVCVLMHVICKASRCVRNMVYLNFAFAFGWHELDMQCERCRFVQVRRLNLSFRRNGSVRLLISTDHLNFSAYIIRCLLYGELHTHST